MPAVLLGVADMTMNDSALPGFHNGSGGNVHPHVVSKIEAVRRLGI